MISHVEQIVRSVPEVESTSRRTGLQLGLAAVTEPNTGDISVKLKDKRSRGIDEIISEVRAKVKTEEPALDVDFTQVLQDMIGDLTGAPQPVVVQALFSRSRICCRPGRRAWRMPWHESTSTARSPWWISRTASKTPRAARRWSSRSIRRRRPRPGFTTDQLTTVASAIVDGEPATTPVIINDRPYTLRVRFPARPGPRSKP